jgi:hypothetical protein
MPVTIENLTKRPVLLRGNSGMTIYVPSRATIETSDAEVVNNTFFLKLKERHVIQLFDVKPEISESDTYSPEKSSQIKGKQKK